MFAGDFFYPKKIRYLNNSKLLSKDELREILVKFNAGNDVAAAIKGVSVGVVIKSIRYVNSSNRKTVDVELKRVKESK